MVREGGRKGVKPTGGAWLTTCPVVPFTDPTGGNLWVSELEDRQHAAWGALAIPSGNAVARSVAQSSEVGKVESSIPKGPTRTSPSSITNMDRNKSMKRVGCPGLLLAQAAHHTTQEGQVLVRERLAVTW